MPGREYAVEGVLSAGRLQALAVFDKPDPLDGPFFEETIYATPPARPEAVAGAILDTVQEAVLALGLRHGAVHAECRVDGGRVVMLEVAPRPIGGLCSRVLRFVASARADDEPISLEELLLRHALGEDVAGWRREPAAAAVMMIPIPRRGHLRRVDGEDGGPRRSRASWTCRSPPGVVSCWNRCRRRAVISGSFSRARGRQARPRRRSGRPTGNCRS